MNYLPQQLVGPAIGVMGSALRFNPLEIFSTTSSAITAVALMVFSYHTYSHSIQSQAQLDFVYTILEQYTTTLNSNGCTFNPTNLKETLSNTHNCLQKIKDIKNQKDTAEEAFGIIKKHTGLDLAVTHPRNEVAALITSYFAGSQATMENQKKTTAQLNEHLKASLGNVKDLSKQTGEFHKDSEICNARLVGCEGDRGRYVQMAADLQENHKECKLEKIGYKDKLEECQINANSVIQERDNCGRTYQTCKSDLQKCKDDLSIAEKNDKKHCGYFTC